MAVVTLKNTLKSTMIVACPNCTTRFSVKAGTLGEVGRKVRCSKCGKEWIQLPITPGQVAPVLPETLSKSAFNFLTSPDPIASPATQTHSSETATNQTFQGLLHNSAKKNGNENTSPPLNSTRAAQKTNKNIFAWAGWGGLVTVLILLLTASILMRDRLIDLLPDTTHLHAIISKSPPDPLEGLEIKGIDLRWERKDGIVILNIKGQIFNLSQLEKSSQEIQVVLLDANEKKLVQWSFEPVRDYISPGGYVDFQTLIRDPPANIATALVKLKAHVRD